MKARDITGKPEPGAPADASPADETRDANRPAPRLASREAGPPHWRGTVTGVGGDPAARVANRLPELVVELRALLDDPAEVEALARAFLERPNP